MAEAIDPNLVKAGLVDMSWVSKGVDNGMDYAMKKQQLDQQTELAKNRAEELSQQRDQLNVQKSLSIFDTMDKALGQTGATRKAYLLKMQNMASALGRPQLIDPTLMAFLGDEKNTDTAKQAIATYRDALAAGHWDEAEKALGGAEGVIDADRMSKFHQELTETMKTKEAIDVQKEQANATAQNAQTNAKRADTEATNDVAKNKVDWFRAQTDRLKAVSDSGDATSKIASDLRKDAGKVQDFYSKFEDDANVVVAGLRKHTAAGDAAANVAMLKLSKVSRTSQAEIQAFGSGLGNYQDQLTQATQKRLGNGELYDDKNRADLMNLAQSLAGQVSSEKKDRLTPIYNTAKVSAPNELAKGMILSPRTLKNTFNENAVGAPSEQNAPPSAPKMPPTMTRFNATQMDALKRVSGKSKAAVEKNFGIKLAPSEAKFLNLTE